MKRQIEIATFVTLFIALSNLSGLWAQQKAQWVPGQYGLNAGVLPDPGFTYEQLPINYSSSRLNDSSGNKVPIPNTSGTYSFWADENIEMFVLKHKILGGHYAAYAEIPFATGSVVADIGALTAGGGGSGLADTFYSPATLGWHFDRADFNVGYAFTAPTGRYVPGASNNVGSGYWGNNLLSGTTAYLTKNKGTSANLYTIWEGHSQKSGTNITPGQAFTMEWGLGQALPLDKQMHKLVQLGFIGYDQFQVTANAGPTRLLPYYSSHGMGLQGNFIALPQGVVLFFKYLGDISAKAAPEGRIFAFGGSWTIKTPTK